MKHSKAYCPLITVEIVENNFRLRYADFGG